MARTVILKGGQRVQVFSISEAMAMLDCGFDELGQWIMDGMVEGGQCSGCGFTYPVRSDIEDLAQLIDQYPVRVSLDEILHERYNQLHPRTPQKSSRQQLYTEEVTYETGPRKKLPPLKQERQFGNQQTVTRRDRR